jgi:hypothetical protein
LFLYLSLGSFITHGLFSDIIWKIEHLLLAICTPHFPNLSSSTLGKWYYLSIVFTPLVIDLSLPLTPGLRIKGSGRRYPSREHRGLQSLGDVQGAQTRGTKCQEQSYFPLSMWDGESFWRFNPTSRTSGVCNTS